MKLFLIASKHCYPHIPPLVAILEKQGHVLVFPNCYTEPEKEDAVRAQGAEAHAQWKADMIHQSIETIASVDGVLVINEEKNGIPNYIGGATFLEIYDAFRLGKKIFFLNPLPEGMLYDELCGFSPVILHGNVSNLS
jgi:hypothetical protein